MNLKLFYFIIFFLPSYQKTLNKQKRIVNIAFAINNKCIDLLYTSLFSLLENSNNSIYYIYILIKNNFENSRKNIIYNLEKIYFNCFIHFINMKRNFKNVFRNKLDISTYYRLKLPIACPNINRIIYIDADTIILKDLIELYILNFNNNYILGRLDIITDELDHLGLYIQTYINAGVLLMDLYSLRKYNYDEIFMNYIKKNNNHKYLIHHAQTTINYVCYNKIGLLRPKYHMWPFTSVDILFKYNEHFRKKYMTRDFEDEFRNPYIVHFPGYFKDIKLNTKYHKIYREYLRKVKEIRELTKIISKDKIKYNYYFVLISAKISVFILEFLLKYIKLRNFTFFFLIQKIYKKIK